jgi:hypothetical protein
VSGDQGLARDVETPTTMNRWLSLSVVITVGCASNVHQIDLRQDAVGTKYARQTGYFAACGTMCSFESTPGQVRHDAVLDEATLTAVGPAETCVDMVVRAHVDHDEPIEQLRPTISIDGRSLRAVVDGESVTVVDFPYTGSSEVLRAEGVTGSTFSELSIERPAALVFRVVQRTARLCAPQAGRAVSIRLHNPHLDFGSSRGLITFAWKLG